MKSADKKLMVLACFLFVIAITSCTSQRPITREEYEKYTVPPQMLETAYNLVRAKLAKLNFVEQIRIEIDTAKCAKYYSIQYDSWFMELLNIGLRQERNVIHYKLSVPRKPYIRSWQRITLQEPGKIFLTRYDDGFAFGDMRQFLCRETVPDTALESVGILDTNVLNESYIPMRFEEAEAIVRNTFGLSEDIPCVDAYPFKEGYPICCYDSTPRVCEGIWYLGFLLEPSDTTLYYDLKNAGENEQEIIRILQERKTQKNLQEDICYGACPATLPYCRINAKRKEICRVGVSIRYNSCSTGDEIDHPNLSPLFKRIRAVQDSLNIVHSSLKFDK